MTETPENIALGIVEKFSWSTNVMRDGRLVGQQYIVAGAIAKAIQDDREPLEREIARLRQAVEMTERHFARNGYSSKRAPRSTLRAALSPATQ